MPITSLQVCMDSSDWLQGSMPDDQITMAMENSSPLTPQSGELGMLTCSRPMMMEPRRLRPQHEQPLKCPRCESTHTKFCYYNNYSLTQPRYFCKTCRRYWTKGGTLRNVPVGGGCRKTKKHSSNSKNNPSKLDSSSSQSSLILHSNEASNLSRHNNNNNNPNSPDLHLAFSEQMQFLSLDGANPSYLLENTPITLMDNKYEALLGGNSYNFMGNHINNGENFGGLIGLHGDGYNGNLPQFGMMPNNEYHNGNENSNVLESCERQMVQFENLGYHNLDRSINHDDHELQDVKPNTAQQHAYNSGRETSFGYSFGGLGSWTGLMNGYGSASSTNPLV